MKALWNDRLHSQPWYHTGVNPIAGVKLQIYFGEDADPKAKAQTAREALVDAQRDAYNKSTTRIDRK